MKNTAAAKSLQSCPTLCDPIDGSPPGSPVPGILQARTLEWVAISFSSAWKWKVKVKSLSCIQLFAAPWTAAYQAPSSMGFSRQEYWSGLPLHCFLQWKTLNIMNKPTAFEENAPWQTDVYILLNASEFIVFYLEDFFGFFWHLSTTKDFTLMVILVHICSI